MIKNLKQRIYDTLRWSEKYTKTDMVYLFKGGGWLTAGHIISFVSALILAVTFANLLPKETYGIYKYIISVFAILSIPTLKKIGMSLVQAISRGYEGNFFEVLHTKIKWGLIGSFASLIVSSYYLINHNYTLAIAFLITTLLIPFFNGFNSYLAYLDGKKLFSKSTKYRGINQIVNTIVLITALLLTNNILIILTTYLLSETITRLIAYLVTINKYPPNKKKDKDVVKYGKHLSFIEVFKVIAEQADKIFVFHYIGAAELAIYAIAVAPIDNIRTYIFSIKTLAMPKLSSANISVIKGALPKQILKSLILIIPIIVIYIFLAPWLFSTFFPEYKESVVFTQILALSLIFAPAALMSTSLSAKKQLTSLYKLKFIGSIGRLVIYFIGVKTFGIMGLVAGRITVDFYYSILYKYYFNKMK